MKLSVRKKVANGLVIFLLMPKAAATASELYGEYADGFAGFSANEDFDLAADSDGSDTASVKITGESGLEGDPSGGDPTGGDPTGGDPTGGDPSGYDPSAFDPSGFDPSGGDPSGCEMASTSPPLTVRAPQLLVTAEDGSSDLFEVLMEADPPFPRTFHIISSDPDEATPEPNTIELFDNACIPQTIWVTGQNDYFIDGDFQYTITVVDEQGARVKTIPGVNLDNDDYLGVAVDVLGPTSLPRGGDGLFLVRVANVSGNDLDKSTLFVEPTEGLRITGYATALLSGDRFKRPAKVNNGVLEFKNVRLPTNDMLIVSLEVVMDDEASGGQSVKARFQSDRNAGETDDDQDIRTAVPEIR